jgi:two-component system, NtrC family, nitrogen regulation response regulator GlnG
MLCNFAMRTRLLVHVDDDDAMGYLLDRALRNSGLTGWEIKYFSSANSAVSYLTSAKLGQTTLPDLLVLDVRMPGIDGLELLGWAGSNVPDVPAVMLSSSELLRDRLQARDLGSKGYFLKSPGFAELLEFLRTWEETALARRSAQAA